MPTIDAVVARAALDMPDRVAVREHGGDAIGYAALERAVARFASRARSAGVVAGDAVAIHLPNSIAYLVALFGAARAGASVAFVNDRLTAIEARRQCDICRARVIVTTAARIGAFRDDPALAGAIVVRGDAGADGFDDLGPVDESDDRTTRSPEGLEDGDAVIRFTSGSTGDAKGLVFSHRAWLVRAVAMMAEEIRIDPGSTTLVLGQLSHQAGLLVIPTFVARGTLLLTAAFDLAVTADALATQAVSCLQVVPTMFARMLGDARMRAALAAHAPRRIVYGGSPIRRAVLDEAMRLMPTTEFVQSYGSQEAGSIAFLNPADHRDPRLRESAGKPLLPARLQLREPDAHGVGEVEANNPWQPHAVVTARGREPLVDAWVRTGDLGTIVDGYVFLVDRIGDMIVSGGFNVYPAEVERVLADHPDVVDAAVTSEPDDTWGERVVAFVVVRKTAAFDEAALRAHCRAVLAGYKVPKDVRPIAEMPLNANGKPDRRRLGAPAWAGKTRRIQ